MSDLEVVPKEIQTALVLDTLRKMDAWIQIMRPMVNDDPVTHTCSRVIVHERRAKLDRYIDLKVKESKVSDIYKAVGDNVPSATILLSTPIPYNRIKADTEELRQVFMKEAEELFQALIASLPGGTLDALLVRLLDHKRSQFVVPSWVIKGQVEERQGKDD